MGGGKMHLLRTHGVDWNWLPLHIPVVSSSDLNFGLSNIILHY